MSIEELLDYCKTLFSDLKFIDLLVKFCADNSAAPSPTKNDKEEPYTIYVNTDKINRLNEIINCLPLIIKKDSNLSVSMGLMLNDEKRRKYDS